MPLKFREKEGSREIEGAKEDYRKANRYGQYKIGDKALFYPDGSYIAIEDMTDPGITKAPVPTKGCCGIVLESPAVEFSLKGQKMRILADSDKQAQKMLAHLKEPRSLKS